MIYYDQTKPDFRNVTSSDFHESKSRLQRLKTSTKVDKRLLKHNNTLGLLRNRVSAEIKSSQAFAELYVLWNITNIYETIKQDKLTRYIPKCWLEFLMSPIVEVNIFEDYKIAIQQYQLAVHTRSPSGPAQVINTMVY